MTATSRTSFQGLTKLPLKEVVKADSTGVALVVQTPFGEQVIDYKRTSRAMFGADRTVDVETSAIIKELHRLEDMTREYLFKKWEESVLK